MRKEKIRRRFTSCLCVLMTVTCIFGSSLSNGPVNEYKVSAAPAENEVLQDQLLPEDPDVKADPNNLAYGRTYTAAWKCDNAYSDDNNELTNGKRGRLNFRDPEWVGFSAGGGVQENWDGVLYFNWFDQSENCNADFTYVFPEEKTFEQINIAMRKGSPWGNANDGVADHIKIQAEIDGEWVTFYEQEGLHTTAGRDLAIKTADGNPVTATGLKFWFYAWTGNVQAVSLAEIEVLAEATAVDANGDLADPAILTETGIPAVSENLLCGLTPICGIKPIYIANIHHENANDPSSPLKSDVFDVLTDGIIPSVQPPTDFYITVDLGSVQSFEQVKIGSLSNVSDGGIWPINKIKVEYSDNGQNWMAFAEQSLSYPGDAVNRYVTAAESAVSGQYVRIHMETNNWYFIDEIEILQLADTNPDANENPNYGSMLNLVSDDKKYTISVKADINDKIGILTDGKYGLTYTKDDPNWMGFSTPGHVAINFDLMASASVYQIILNAGKDTANGLKVPQNLIYAISSDGEHWSKLKIFDNNPQTEEANFCPTWDGSVDASQGPLPDANAVYTRYIRIEFDVPAGGCVGIDEVKVLGKLGKTSDANLPYSFDEDGTCNLARGASYTYLPEGVTNQWSDATMQKLTDGICGSTEFYDGKWVGFCQSDCGDPFDSWRTNWPVRSIVVDLGGEKTVESISFHTVIGKAAAINPSSRMNLLVSVDGEKWTQITESRSAGIDIADGRYTYGWRTMDLSANGLSITNLVPDIEKMVARYIRLDAMVEPWLFIDEISVRGYPDIKSDATYPAGNAIFDGHYQTAEEAGGVQDMVLCYNGWYGYDEEAGMESGDLSLSSLRPLLTYIDSDNKGVDTMFDTVLLLGLRSQYGNAFVSAKQDDKTAAKDWEWYLDKTFAEGRDVDTLEEAAKIASHELGDPNYKVNLVVMYPTFSCIDKKNFGSLGGRNLTFQTEEDYQYALEWWLDEVLKRFEAGEYKYVNFKGFYWLEEGVSEVVDQQRMMTFNDEVHERDYRSYWIPYWTADGKYLGHQLGFDGITLQPSHFFKSPYSHNSFSQPTKEGNPLMPNHAKQVKYFEIGPEFEVDGEAYSNFVKYNVWLDYLNSAAENGMDGPGLHRDWYYGTPLANAAYSGNAIVRTIYEYAYQVMRGTYTPKEYIAAEQFPGNPDIGGIVNGVTGGGTSENTGGATSGGGLIKPDKPSSGKFAWEKINGVWKLKGADGKYITGWKKIDGLWFYMNADAVMQKGWQKVGNSWYYLKDSGAMAIGWQKIGNQWYYLNAGGEMKIGWLQEGGIWYYLKANGAMATGWNWIGNKCYYFYIGGKMAANTSISGYPLNADGTWVQ